VDWKNQLSNGKLNKLKKRRQIISTIKKKLQNRRLKFKSLKKNPNMIQILKKNLKKQISRKVIGVLTLTKVIKHFR
jgi:hypothetical protein